jgi:hypothetical protein
MRLAKCNGVLKSWPWAAEKSIFSGGEVIGWLAGGSMVAAASSD